MTAIWRRLGAWLSPRPSVLMFSALDWYPVSPVGGQPRMEVTLAHHRGPGVLATVWRDRVYGSEQVYVDTFTGPHAVVLTASEPFTGHVRVS